ncbi:MAG: hypothetical protein MI920_37335 [Kiloniellales bacterium]|nr:hypothetical protein [Kiloniellales bacterium]
MPLPMALKALARLLLRQPWSAAVLGWLMARRLRLRQDCDRDDALDVLVFSDYRWLQDLEALARPDALRLHTIDETFLGWVNAIFAVPGKAPHPEYFLERDPKILEAREAQAAFIARVIRALRRHRKLDCAVTPAIHYRREQAWAAGCHAAGLPFVAFHKEFTVLDESHLPERIERFKGRRQRFLGTHVCVTNRTGKRLFAEAEVFPEDRITVMGLLRIDNLLHADARRETQSEAGKRVVTLFSFGAVSGGVTVTRSRSPYFTSSEDEGFVALFRDVHVGFAEVALRHPEITFKIKPKAAMELWSAEIEKTIQENLGRSLDSIPNCHIVAEPAPALIRESLATIGFNSTVLLESCLLGCNTIMPFFHEATGRHSAYVFFPEFRDAFALATSKQDLLDKIDAAIGGAHLHGGDRGRLSELCRFYLGYDDGRTAERAIDVLRQVVAGGVPPQAYPQERSVVLDSAQREAAPDEQAPAYAETA